MNKRKERSNMICKRLTPNERPTFPKRAIITAGMPYGNKNLHFGHVGGMFIHADIFARFLRDRIGKDNVIFLSGTDCYGSPIMESYRKLQEAGEQIRLMAEKAVLDYERYMYNHEFHRISYVLDDFIRSINKQWVNNVKIADATNDAEFRKQLVVECF